MNTPHHRPLSVGPLRAFEAVARLSSFIGAAGELHLTQPAISRQIRALEDELGARLFSRGTRHVELTSAGATLLRAVAPMLDRLDASVRQLRIGQGRQQVGLTTFASFASLWLLPRLQSFQQAHPHTDIRISAHDTLADLDDPDLDVALRYARPENVPPGSQLLFGEVLTPVASPKLRGLRKPEDLARHTLLEEDDARPSAEYLSWRRWLRLHAPAGQQPQGWMFLNFTYQQIQAAVAGQGVALARLMLVHDALQRGELIEPFGTGGRMNSPYAYWLVRWPGRQERPELAAFETWVLEQARLTREAVMPASSTVAAPVHAAARSTRHKDRINSAP
jgi:LysR family transcriptional regulator, glycine cleavage system transcriptional activator